MLVTISVSKRGTVKFSEEYYKLHMYMCTSHVCTQCIHPPPKFLPVVVEL